ncbi:MAG: glycerol-3-phosphate ABC transporter ATP-binding protein [Candidatus Marinimicrobia bacterium]|jgi:multiple sugar transport system ATP-binding protein|nr:glycerol-3-phosphate ABC transporter ATP-binding protein [Candidatus Neomarinimicrobiota bacterium]|tara:strand:+ start:1346 stop:2428 length:1083 start_codon:yes stop_codon:yes gene_type:complete
MSSLKLEEVSKSYGENDILKDISLDVDDGEFLVLVGPSGCGKSTTLRLIAGLEEPSKGSIIIDKKIVNEKDPSDRDIAMVFQNYALYPQMTVKENMEFGLKIRKLEKNEIDLRVLEAARILKIENLLGRKPKELSGGQRQRVALGRAIVRKPKVFLFDEPLSNLDAKLRQEMRVEIKKIHNLLGTTMIYVTHDQTEAMTMGDRIAVMNDGIIEQLDTPTTIYNKPQNIFTSTFVGTPQINLVNGELVEKNDNWYFISNNLEIPFSEKHRQFSRFLNKKVTLGIRPEDIIIEMDSESNNSNVKINFVENLGSEMNLHFSFDDIKFVAKINNSENNFLNHFCKIKFKINNIHIFDLKSEEAL